MKQLLWVFCILLLPIGGWAAIGSNTDINISPACVLPGEPYHFQIRVDFMSPDGEKLKAFQFWIGDTWSFDETYVPAAGSVPGSWSVTVNPNGNVAEWTFTRANGQPGGGVASGESVTFAFDGTVGTENDMGIQAHIWGDVAVPTGPHTMEWIADYPICSADDDTADDDSTPTDDDTTPADDDTTPTDDDTTPADDDTTPTDDDTTPAADDDSGDDDKGDDSGESCGC